MEKISPLDLAVNILEFREESERQYDHAAQVSGGWGGPHSPLEFTPGRTRTYDHRGNPNDSDND